MYLKSIEIHGFKSFANKTVFKFHNGVTAIVGPNGSGKSNVADAVRWVLGEQRIKQLRGGSMQDVIFAGTQQRKPLGYASVSITLDNADHILPVSYDEVTVTRRLYRSGESEYLLNGTQCRLKDINELFYDTGIGKEGYSIIGQGQIDKILSGKPEDRRELFDEAVGIVKFKRRKAEAQRKLDSEQQNLERISDILNELTRQLGPLARQSEKARIYLNKKEQLKAYDVNSFLYEYQELKDRLNETRQLSENADAELAQVRREAQEIRESYDKTVQDLEEASRRQEELQSAISEGTLNVSRSSSRIELLEEQIAAAARSDQQKKQRIEVIVTEVSQRQERIAVQHSVLQELETHTQETVHRDEQFARELEQVLRQIQDLTMHVEKQRQELMALLDKRAQTLAEGQRYDTMLQQLEIRKSEGAGRMLRLDTDRTDQETAICRVESEGAEIEKQIKDLTTVSDEAGRRLEKIRSQLSDRQQRLEEEQQAYHRLASRLETLRNIAERYDGYGSSIRKVMECRSSNKGILGVVADLIKTEQKYETAIETALGGSIQNIVTEDEETAKRMIAYLKEHRYGRATFLPLTAMKPSGSVQKEALNFPGVIALASELVHCDERYEALSRQLLGRTVVTDTIDSAIALERKFRYSLRVVTLDGELLSPGGSMSGGAYKNSSNLLGRRREIEDLDKKVKASAAVIDELRSAIESGRKKQGELREQIRSLSEQLQGQYIRQNTNRMESKELQDNQGRTSRTYQELENELKEISGKIAQAQQGKTDVQASLEQIRQTQDELEADQGKAENEQAALREEESRLRAESEALHVELASCEQKAQYMRAECDRFAREVDELTRERAELENAEDLEKAVSERKQEIAGLKESIARVEAQNTAHREQLQAVSQQKDALGQTQKAFFDRREELNERESLLDKECFRLTERITRLEETRESRIAYMWDEYELTYTTALKLKREDLGSRNDWKKQMSSLRKDIKELGSVNVNAIEEYKEISERHTFLSGQHEDLLKAQEALEKIIRQLDEGMRKQFKEQFGRIQTEFDLSFKQLFGGGQGTLELVDDEDVLEAGIRIVAQPPGKKLQNMMQLSGGEKSLTAIALLFAIQNLKPSPFCLLDEIEAALDENNVERYAGYLHKLTKHTQFIIITHRRGTMAAADRMYGITMQEKGISALVSVNLIEGELDS